MPTQDTPTIPKVDNWRCGGCDGTEYEHTAHINVMGYGNNLVRCLTCGLKSYDWEPVKLDGTVWENDEINNGQAAHERADRTWRLGSMAATDETAEGIAKQRKLRRHFYSHVLIEELIRHAGVVKSMYEVGTDLGEFLYCAREDKGVEIVAGCEPNKRSTEIGAAQFGVTIENCYFAQATGVKLGMWDTIIMLDVIEHTDQPRRDLEKAFRHLRPGGVVLLKTFYDEFHDTLDLNIRDRAAWKDPSHGYFGPGHRFHFDQPVLRALVERVGFEIVSEKLNVVHGQITLYMRKPCA